MASYNGGFGHLIDARRLAEQKGLNPNLWDDNVEDAFWLLSQKKYASKARHGWCRAKEIVSYVNEIFLRFYHYQAKVKAAN
ncbi:MAG: hypothetical protein GY750_07180 [Lentisphaerae bacterium]|nr:hypothetical protein [Lentisphaerota bacterium]MCP4101192.1 hypothetical protein [Lentisphaerota bacterium]